MKSINKNNFLLKQAIAYRNKSELDSYLKFILIMGLPMPEKEWNQKDR